MSTSSPESPATVTSSLFSNAEVTAEDSHISLRVCPTDAVRAVAGNLTNSLRIVILFTVLVILIELGTGTYAKAHCLIFDSFLMIGEFVSLVVAYFCMKKADDINIDYVRYEVVGSFCISIGMTASTYTTQISVLTRLMNPEPMEKPVLVLLVGIVGVLQNITSYLLVGQYRRTGGDHHHSFQLSLPWSFLNDAPQNSATTIDSVEDDTQMEKLFYFTRKTGGKSHLLTSLMEKELNKSEEKSKRLDSEVFNYFICDLVASTVSMISAVTSIVFSNYDFVVHIDPILSLIFSFYIGYGAVRGTIEGFMSMLQKSPTSLDTIAIKNDLLKIIEIINIIDFDVIDFTPYIIVANLKIEVHSPQVYEVVRPKVKTFFHNRGIHLTTIQPVFREE